MSEERKIRKDGGPDGRGHADGSRASQFRTDDGRKRSGRPKGAKSLATLYREISKIPVSVTMPNGKVRKISTVEAIVMKQREKALRGGERAGERFIERLHQYSPPEVQTDRTTELLEEDSALLAAALGRGATSWVTPPPVLPAPVAEESPVENDAPVTEGQTQ